MRIFKRLVLSAGFFITGFSAVAGDAGPAPVPVNTERLTLKQCYALALTRSETIWIQKELIREAEGQAYQALSGALPRAAFGYSQKWQDVRPDNTFGGYAPEAKFTFTQPLFSGFKEFAAISASRHIGKQRAEEQRRAEQLLFADVADAFSLYLMYQQDLAVQEETWRVLDDRVEELKKRQSLGKSRASEAGSAQAKLSRTESNMEAVRGQMASARFLLEFLVGRPVNALFTESIPAGDEGAEAFVSRIDARPDVKAARESLEALRKNTTIARAAFFPSVSVTGNSYVKRPDSYEGNGWDILLSVNVPLFNGLNDVGQVSQAKAQFNEAELKLSQVRRKAWLEIRNAVVKLASARKQVAALAKTVGASERNYELQRQDFERNLVNNLDVLQALEDLQADRRAYVAATAEMNRNFWALKVATGENLK
jgi:outer membrane protein TolC